MIYVALDHDFFGGEGAYIETPEQEFKIQNKKPKYNIYGFIDKPIQYKKKKAEFKKLMAKLDRMEQY